MRALVPGTRINEIAGSTLRYPAWQVLVWNPHLTTINDLASRHETSAPINISDFVDSFDFEENIGYESGNDPQTTKCTFTLKRNPNTGQNIRRGLLEDGVLVRVFEGDARLENDGGMVPIFTGTFRGRPGDNPGMPHDKSEGFEAAAYGREERFLNLVVTSETYPVDTDLGVMGVAIAQKYMGLGEDEILFGATGFESKHVVNQIVDLPALESIWSIAFPSGKKPKFNALGQLCLVDVDLDKPAARGYATDDLIKIRVASPNDVEVNNSVILRGLDHDQTRIIQELQLLTEFEVVTGFFDSEYDEDIYYSSDHSQTAQDTFLKQKTRIKWSSADWEEVDEFHGRVTIDTHYLRNARVIIFILWLIVEIAVAVLTYVNDILASILEVEAVAIISAIATILKIASLILLALLLWAMQFVGRGRYQIFGKPFEYVYQELVSQHELDGLEPEEVRQAEFRNDFMSTMADLDARCAELLRREILKNQLYEIEIMNDPFLEVDDIIEMENGDRYYITRVTKKVSRLAEPTMRLICWKVFERRVADIEALELHSSEV